MGRLCRIALIVGLLGLLLAAPVLGEDPNLIKNGSFEEPFVNGLATDWQSFSNGGRANYGWHGDDWKPVVYDGQWSQLIEINTKGQGGDADRYAGIYQTVSVEPGKTYRLTIHGLVRSSEGSTASSSFGYRLQWAVDLSGGTDWQKVGGGAAAAWQEIPWREWPLLEPGRMETFTTDITANSDKLTLYIRAWKKWGNPGQEGNFNVDGISLVPVATATPTPGAPATELPQTGLGLGFAVPVAGLLLGASALGVRWVRRRA